MVSTVAIIRPKMMVTAMAMKKASSSSGIRPSAVVSAAIATGRELYAVPGPIDAMASRGTNRLIADQLAVMVTSSAALLRQVGLSRGRRAPAVEALSEVEGQLLRHLLERTGSIEELIDQPRARDVGIPPSGPADRHRRTCCAAVDEGDDDGAGRVYAQQVRPVKVV